jgi:translation initiation factor 5
MVTSEKHQKSLLGGIERLAGLEHPELIAIIPKILMEFYQADVLEEDVVTSWGTHVSKKYVDKETSKKVRKASEPFLKVGIVTLATIAFFSDNDMQWLAEAEDDDDED